MINGCVFRNGAKFYLISFLTEKRYLIEDKFYLTCEDGKCLPDHSIMLVEYTEHISKKNGKTVVIYTTKPITCFMLTKDGKPTQVKNYDNDAIIPSCFRASKLYLDIKKATIQ